MIKNKKKMLKNKKKMIKNKIKMIKNKIKIKRNNKKIKNNKKIIIIVNNLPRLLKGQQKPKAKNDFFLYKINININNKLKFIFFSNILLFLLYKD